LPQKRQGRGAALTQEGQTSALRQPVAACKGVAGPRTRSAPKVRRATERNLLLYSSARSSWSDRPLRRQWSPGLALSTRPPQGPEVPSRHARVVRRPFSPPGSSNTGRGSHRAPAAPGAIGVRPRSDHRSLRAVFVCGCAIRLNWPSGQARPAAPGQRRELGAAGNLPQQPRQGMAIARLPAWPMPPTSFGSPSMKR